MLARFGRQARAVVVASEAQAQADGSEAVAAHHLLLAATAVPTEAAWALATRGLDEARLRDALDRCCGVPFPPHDGRVPLRPDPGAPRVPFSRDAQAVLAGAARVADGRGRSSVGPAEVAVASLIVAARAIGPAFDDLGLDPEEVARALR